MSIYVNDRLVGFTQYPNGETVVPDVSDVVQSGIHRELIEVRLHWEDDTDLVKLVLLRGMIGQILRDADAEDLRPRLLIDYMPYSRMDRAQEGMCFSLHYIIPLVKSLDWDLIQVVEPHSYTTELLLSAKPIWSTAKLTPKVMRMMGFDKERDYLVLPDAGAHKRYSTQIPELNTCNVIVLKKTRDFTTGRINGLAVDYRIQRGNQGFIPVDNKALIIDDLSSRGGTFVRAAELLRDQFKFATVNLLVTHMEPVGLTGDLPTKLDRVYCTDTMTVPRPLPGNFEIFQRSDWA